MKAICLDLLKLVRKRCVCLPKRPVRMSDQRDYLREHWRNRCDRIAGELRGMESGLRAVPNTPEGQEIRMIIQSRAEELQAQLLVLEGYLGAGELTPVSQPVTTE